jgi:2-polyprenyl-6-methoxyphenol hydroxylase-like FAD-dependent oxidoreductase
MAEKIAIIGAGMNGVALALMLQMFGIKANIYEQAVEPRVDGTGICVWPEGVQILTALLGKTTVQSLGGMAQDFTTATATGDVINNMPLAQVSPYYLTNMGLFHRRDIYQALLSRLPSEQLHCSKKLVNITETEQCSQLEFADGSFVQADIVIGADGVFSKVRRLLFPEAKFVNSGVKVCRGITEFSTPLIADDTVYVFAGQQSRIVTYTINADTQMKYWFAARYDEQNQELPNKAEVIKNFNYYTPELLNMIKQTDDRNIISSTLFELKSMPSWSKGRVSLLGDACCASLPSMAIGFSLGLENAFILAQCLASNCATAEKAFQRYEHRTLARSNKLMALTAELDEMNYRTELVPERVAKIYQEFFHYINQSPF